MKGYLLDTIPKFGEVSLRLKDNNGKEFTYILRRINNNGCVLSIIEEGIEKDHVVFTLMDMKALYCLLTVKE